MLSTIGGGIIDAAMGEGLLQRGSSRLESESSPCLFEETFENKDLGIDIVSVCLYNAQKQVGERVHILPLHDCLECRT